MDAFKCDNCNEYFDLKPEDKDSDGDHYTFHMEAGEWGAIIGIVRIIPPVSEESPEHGKEKDVHHIDGIQAIEIPNLPDGIKGLLGAISGHTHKAGEPQRVKADLCQKCRKVVLKLLADEYIQEKVKEEPVV